MTDKQNKFDPQQTYPQSAPKSSVNSQNNNSAPSALPEGWRQNPEQGKNPKLVYFSKAVEIDSYTAVRLVGYGLLAFALIDYVSILIPPHFTNPFWEFETIGAMVDHVVAPLLGLLFVFYRPQRFVGKKEKTFLQLLSRLSLLVGVLYLLMIPLGVIDTSRIDNYSDAQINIQVFQQIQQFQQIREQLQSSKSDEEIKNIVASHTPPGNSLPAANPQELKKQLLANVAQNQQVVTDQAESAKVAERNKLIRNSVKWNLGALIAGILFIGLWHLTQWARVKIWQ